MSEAKSAKDYGEAIGGLEVLAGVCFAFPKIGQKARAVGLGHLAKLWSCQHWAGFAGERALPPHLGR